MQFHFKPDPAQEQNMLARAKPSQSIQIEYMAAVNREERANMVIDNLQKSDPDSIHTTEYTTAAVLFFGAYSNYKNALQGYVSFKLETGFTIKSDDIECAEFICRKAAEMALNAYLYMDTSDEKERSAILDAEVNSKELYALASYLHSLSTEEVRQAFSKYQDSLSQLLRPVDEHPDASKSRMLETKARYETLADNFKKNDNYDYAAKWYRKAANIAKHLGDEESWSSLMISIIKMYIGAAADICAEANNNASSIKPDIKQAYSKAMDYYLRAAAVSENDLCDIRSALILREKAAKISEKIENK